MKKLSNYCMEHLYLISTLVLATVNVIMALSAAIQGKYGTLGVGLFISVFGLVPTLIMTLFVSVLTYMVFGFTHTQPKTKDVQFALARWLYLSFCATNLVFFANYILHIPALFMICGVWAVIVISAIIIGINMCTSATYRYWEQYRLAKNN